MTGVPGPPGGGTYYLGHRHYFVLFHGVPKLNAIMLHAGVNAPNHHVALHPLRLAEEVVEDHLDQILRPAARASCAYTATGVISVI